MLMTKTTRLLKKKAWIGSPIIAVNAEPSDVPLNKPSPTGNGRNPSYMLMMNRTLCGLEIPCPRININSDFFNFKDDAADHLHERCQRRGYECGTFMSQVWSSLRGIHPTMSPSSQVPRALDPARLGPRHAYRHPDAVSFRSTCLPSHHPPVLTT